MLADETWVITGGAGGIATSLRPALSKRLKRVCLLDPRPVEPEHDNEEMIVADVRDQAAITTAIAGADGVLHLGGIPEEADFHDLAAVNIIGTFHVLEAARRAGARRVVFASTGRTTGFYDVTTTVRPDMPPRPDGLYGASKIAAETVGRVYSDKFGLSVINMRIGSFEAHPRDRRDLSTWLSAGDCERAVFTAMDVADTPYATFYAISANTRRWVDLAPGEALGYFPQDDAEQFADQFDAVEPEPTGPQGARYATPEYTLGVQREPSA